ncbi:helix-turn-helix transcriptional regulator [Corynebacterium bovis]|nr:hypothetical protein CXF46_10770 [Corynebacterium bovis]
MLNPRTRQRNHMPAGRTKPLNGAHLEKLQSDAEVTKQEIAAYTGVTTNVVTRWFNESSSPSPNRALLLAQCLQVDVLDLLGITLAEADIVDLRHRTGRTVQDVVIASRNQLSATTIHNIERAIRSPSEEKFAILANLYNVNLDQIHQSWINRRASLFGRESLEFLTKEEKERFSQSL